MAFRVDQILRSPLGVGAGVTAMIIVVGTGYVFLKPQPNSSTAAQPPSETAQSPADPLAAFRGCLTIVNDPQPPLNVRAAPTDRFDNIIGKVEDGNPVMVIGKQRGWLQISTPVPGWVDKSLTKTICDQAEQAELEKSIAIKTDVGNRVLAEAIEEYQSGDLTSAIKLMKTIPEDSSVYAQAQVALKTMPNEWKRAKSLYGKAQTALKENKAEDVLKLVGEVPDVRYWRQKFTPLVKQAIYYQQHGTSASQRKPK